MVEVGPARDRLPGSLELRELKGNHWEPSIGGVCPTFQPLKVLSDAIWRNLATSHFDVGGLLFEIASVTEVHQLDFLNPQWQSSRGWNLCFFFEGFFLEGCEAYGKQKIAQHRRTHTLGSCIITASAWQLAAFESCK